MSQPDQYQDFAARALPAAEIVVFPVEVDVTCSETLGEALLAAFRQGVRVVIADMSMTQYCDSSGIRHLILANNQAACTDAELRVVAASPAIRRVLHVLEVDQLLRLYPDMACALAGASGE